MSDDLGDRMKRYEGVEADRRLLPLVPIIARLDGKCFHSYTKDLARPFDSGMSSLMVRVTQALMEESQPSFGYTQSDEITLGWYSADYQSQVWFDGRLQKMCSVLASMCTGHFNKLAPEYISPPGLGFFDCRVWQVPTLEEAANTVLWRELDATKNAISMAARHYYSHKELEGKSGSQMQEMLFQKGVNFNDYPSFFKRGTFVLKRRQLTKFTSEELERLPEKHSARLDPDLQIERSVIRVVYMPRFSTVTNRVGVLFQNEDPKIGVST